MIWAKVPDLAWSANTFSIIKPKSVGDAHCMLSHDTPLQCVSLLQRRALIFLRMSCQLGFVYCFACVHPFLLKLTLVRSGGKIVIAVYPPSTTSPRSNSAFSETTKPYHVPLRNVRCCGIQWEPAVPGRIGQCSTRAITLALCRVCTLKAKTKEMSVASSCVPCATEWDAVDPPPPRPPSSPVQGTCW